MSRPRAASVGWSGQAARAGRAGAHRVAVRAKRNWNRSSTPFAIAFPQDSSGIDEVRQQRASSSPEARNAVSARQPIWRSSVLQPMPGSPRSSTRSQKPKYWSPRECFATPRPGRSGPLSTAFPAPRRAFLRTQCWIYSRSARSLFAHRLSRDARRSARQRH